MSTMFYSFPLPNVPYLCPLRHQSHRSLRRNFCRYSPQHPSGFHRYGFHLAPECQTIGILLMYTPWKEQTDVKSHYSSTYTFNFFTPFNNIVLKNFKSHNIKLANYSK